MTDINPFIFRAYDVRGKVGIDITPEVFAEVGRAFGTLVRRRGGHAVALGMDNRTTSPSLKESFGAGVLSTGIDVVCARPIHHSAPRAEPARARGHSASTASSTGCAGAAPRGSQNVVK